MLYPPPYPFAAYNAIYSIATKALSKKYLPSDSKYAQFSSSVHIDERLSNIELLRIIAMFLVLVVHANFFSISAPTQIETVESTIPSIVRFFFQSFSIICVDLFILISGWFGIKPKLKSLANFLFQCFFFLIGIYTVMLLCGLTTLSVKGILGCFFMLKWNWFIKAYLGLYLLAPFLNAYIEKSTEKQFRLILLYFFVFQTIYGWSGAAEFFLGGYSSMSFVGLYLLARYVHLYPNKLTSFSKNVDLAIFIVIVLFETFLSFMLVRFGFYSLEGLVFSYISPLVIISAFYLLLYFSKLNIKSRIINWIATSCFAVFLLHTNPELCLSYFKPFVKSLYTNYTGVICLFYIALFLIWIYIVAVLIDQVRKYCWNRFWSLCIFPKIKKCDCSSK